MAHGAERLFTVMDRNIEAFADGGHCILLLDVTRDGPVVWRHAVGQIEHHFIDIAPSPTLRRIVAFDDRMMRGVEMLGRMPVRRAVAATDMAAGAAEPQMHPG